MPQKPSKTKDGDLDLDVSSEAIDVECFHGLESHALTAREQLMRQWPSAAWETR